GDQIDRDENAAVNILRLGLRTTGHVGTYAWRDSASSWVGEIQSKQAESLNQASLTP
ncbi:MAG: transposase, partial [Cyanobacteria bacterium QH_10_48_56]